MLKWVQYTTRRNRSIPVQTQAYKYNCVKFYRLGTSQLSLILIILQFWMITFSHTGDTTRSLTFWVREDIICLPPPLNYLCFDFRLCSLYRPHSPSLISSSVFSSLMTSLLSHKIALHLHLSKKNTSMSVSESFASYSQLLDAVTHRGNLIFMRCFALTIYGFHNNSSTV